MLDDLQKLYNTLLLIETRGESTKIMGSCISYIEEMIKNATTQSINDEVKQNGDQSI